MRLFFIYLYNRALFASQLTGLAYTGQIATQSGKAALRSLNGRGFYAARIRACLSAPHCHIRRGIHKPKILSALKIFHIHKK